MARSNVVLKTDIKRKKGFIYFCGTDKETGNITVCRNPLKKD